MRLQELQELDALIRECDEAEAAIPRRKARPRSCEVTQPRSTAAHVIIARKAELERLAADMRQRNLHGRGGASRRRIIRNRTGVDPLG